MSLPPVPESIRVVVVDDHAVVREGLRAVFQSADDISLVGEARTGDGACEMLSAVKADVVLLDLRLPDGDGIRVLQRLRESGCAARVIVLTAFAEERCVRAAIDGGACGFLSKRWATSARLVDAVRQAHRGLSAVSPDALSTLITAVREEHAVGPERLTDREREVWHLLASGMTNAEIALALFISERTVKFHVGNVLRKTGSRSRAEATALAYRTGLMDQDS